MAAVSVPVKIVELISAFANHLQTDFPKNNSKKSPFEHIADLRAGFEGWIKIEFVLWAISKYGLNPLDSGDKGTHGIGIEESVALCGKRHSKNVDIWLYVGKKGTHYIELKSLVKDYNEFKQVGSWITDFIHLKNMSEKQYPIGVASVLFATSGSDEKWTPATWKKYLINFTSKFNISKIDYLEIITDKIAIAALINQKR